MTDYSEGTDALHTAAAAAIDTADKTAEEAQGSVRASEQYFSATAEIMRGLYIKLIDMAEANALAAFELARQIVNARGPNDIIESCTAHARKQFELLNRQTKELEDHAQTISREVVPSGARSIH